MRAQAEKAIKNQILAPFKIAIDKLGTTIKDPNENGLTLLHLIADSPSYISVTLLFSLLKTARSKGIVFSQILDSQDKKGLTAFTYCLNPQKNLEWRMQLMLQLLRNGANPYAGKVNNPVLTFNDRELKVISSSPNLNLLYQEIDSLTKTIRTTLSASPMSDLFKESIMAPKVAPPLEQKSELPFPS
jgi:hypothetical protein